jgi:hypothetical protein
MLDGPHRRVLPFPLALTLAFRVLGLLLAAALLLCGCTDVLKNFA